MVDSETVPRGQSEVLGVVLLLTLVLAVCITVVVVGAQAIGDAESETSLESASLTMSELQSVASTTGEGSSRRVSFADAGGGGGLVASGNGPNGDSLAVEPDAGRVTVTVYDSSADTGVDVVDEDLGRVAYGKNGRTVAYQGGGVFRKADDSDASVVVSPPPFEYDSSGDHPTMSLQFPTISSSGGDVSGESLTVERTGSDRAFPGSGSITPPLEASDEASVTIQSDYYRAWGEFLEERTGASATYYPDDDEVSITLSNPPDPDVAIAPLISGGTTGTMDVRNQISIDSYDSEDGSYASQPHGSAPIYANSNVHVADDATVHDVYTMGEATIDGTAGTVYHDDGLTGEGSATDGGPVPSGSMPTVTNYDTIIEDEISEIQSDNDNGPTVYPTVNKIENGNCGEDLPNECVLQEGDYFVQNVDLNARDRLVFEPDGGTIRLAVPDGIDTKRNSEIRVRGPGTVVVFSTDDVKFGSGATVENAGDDAPQFRIWQHSDHTTELGSEVKFVGLIHAGQDGKIVVDSNENGPIYGALIGDFTESPAEAGRPLHYDEALGDIAGPGVTIDTESDTIGYLRVTTTEVTATD